MENKKTKDILKNYKAEIVSCVGMGTFAIYMCNLDMICGTTFEKCAIGTIFVGTSMLDANLLINNSQKSGGRRLK